MKKSVIIIVFLALFLLTLISAGFALEAQTTAQPQSALEKQVQIPEGLQLAVRVLLGIKSDTIIDFQTLVILICTFAVFLFIIRDIMTAMPFLNTKIQSVISAFLVTALIGISGGMLLFVDFMLSIGSFFGLLAKWPIASLTVALALLIGIAYILQKVIEPLKRKSKVEKAEIEGYQAGATISQLRKISKSLEK